VTFKSFLYLDEYKMYSISSQLFGGMTREYIEFTDAETTKTEEQRGPWLSGNRLSDNTREIRRVQRSRSEHDYAYSLFEEELDKRGFLLDLAPEVEFEPASVAAADLVRVTGFADFNDNVALSTVIKNFNQLARATTELAHHGEFEAAWNELRDQSHTKQNPQKLKEARKALEKGMEELVKKASQPPEMLQNLLQLLDHGLGQQLELRVSPHLPSTSVVVTSLLNRECLRESEPSLIAKYGRRAQLPLTVVGLVTQCGSDFPNEGSPIRKRPTESDSDSPPSSMKEAILGLIARLSAMEAFFLQIGDNELRIDPIAVYRRMRALKQ